MKFQFYVVNLLSDKNYSQSMSFVKSLFQCIALSVVMISVMTSCGTSRKSTVTTRGQKGSSVYHPVEFVKINPDLHAPEKALLTEAKKWLGTPYKYGGESNDGIDCSALMLNVFRDALAIKLPRSSRQQFDFTEAISKSELIPGDLIFFATGRDKKTVSHVGMYIGEDKMVHSSASRGVMVSRINEEYFVNTFVAAGRVGSYYAMLQKRKDEPQPIPESPSLEETIITYEAVNQLPTRNIQPSQPEPTASGVNSVLAAVNSSGTSSPQLSAEEARLKVLNSLIEEKIDSIYSISAE